jgi:glucosamine 6-phosphate synthetase-like amidotransferase/phosphosugar isomerase protein
MCAIFGIGFIKNHRVVNSDAIKLIIKNLFALSQDRGRIATGLAISNENEVSVVKKNVAASTFVNEKEYIDFVEERIDFGVERKLKPISVIGHCRFPTKGSAENNHNNHPIVANNIIGVHNGHIGNDDHLFKLFDKIERKAEVDSEIIFRLIDFYSYQSENIVTEVTEAVKKASMFMEGSYACGFVSSRNPHMLHIFRNSGPIDVVFFPKVGMVVFSSSLVYINKATAVADLGRMKTIEMPMNSGIVFNLYANKMYRYKLRERINRSGYSNLEY